MAQQRNIVSSHEGCPRILETTAIQGTWIHASQYYQWRRFYIMNFKSIRLPLSHCLIYTIPYLFFLLADGFTARLPVRSSTTTGSTTATFMEGSNHKCQKIIVVGGGVGGLAVASRLAGPTTDITILEKQGSVGGRCGSWIDEMGFRHERGPSLLLLPHIYEQLFQDVAQSSAKEYGFEYQRCVPSYRAIFDDGDFIDLGYPLNHTEYSTMVSNMDRLEPEGSSRWNDYMRVCEAFLDCGLPNFIEERLDLSTFPNFLFQALRGFGKAWPLKAHSDVLDGIFTSPKIKGFGFVSRSLRWS
jgi:NAD(P)-binding Rossmann-like domain